MIVLDLLYVPIAKSTAYKSRKGVDIENITAK